MHIIIVMICYVLSAILPQTLYFIFPILFIYTLGLKGSLPINRLTRIYLSIFITVSIFLVIHIFSHQSIKYIFLKGLLRYFSYAAFALYLARLSVRDISIIFRVIFILLLLTLPLTIYQFIFFGRGANIFMHSNHFAYVLVICFIFLLKTKRFILAPILYLILIASLIMTKTTGAMLTLVVFLVFHYHAKIKSIYIRIPIIALVLLFFIFGFSFFPKIIEQISSLQYLDWEFIKEKAIAARPGGYGSFIWRVIYWVQILISFFDNNYIIIFTGEGIDSLTKANRDMYGFLYTDPHNDFIKILVEYGVVGLSLFILLLYRLYTFLGRRVDILLILAIPLFFDNILVNWSYNIIFLLYITYFYKVDISAK